MLIRALKPIFQHQLAGGRMRELARAFSDKATPSDLERLGVATSDHLDLGALMKVSKNGKISLRERTDYTKEERKYKKKYEPPGSARIPGSVEQLPSPPKPDKPKKKPVKKPVVPQGPNEKLINLSGTGTFENHSEFINWVEINLPFELRELVYHSIRKVKEEVRKRVLRPLHPTTLQMVADLKHSINSIFRRIYPELTIKWEHSPVNFLNFPSDHDLAIIREEIQLKRNEAQQEIMQLEMTEHSEALSTLEHQLVGLRPSPPPIVDSFQSKLSQHFYQEPGPFIRTGWVYLYGFPYEFNEENVFSELKRLLSGKFAIQEIEFFQHKDIITKEIPVPQTIAIENETTEKRLEQLMDTVVQNVKRKKLMHRIETKNAIPTPSPNASPKKEIVLLSKKISMTSDRSYDHSYAFMRLENPELKDLLLTSDFRVFGINFKNLRIRLDDADFKRVIYLKNLPLGITAIDFLEELNAFLSKHGLSPFVIREDFVNKQLVHDEVLLTFRSFEEGLIASRALRGFHLRGKKVVVSHRYGGLVFIDGKFKEMSHSLFERMEPKLLRTNQDQAFSRFLEHRNFPEPAQINSKNGLSFDALLF